MPVILTYDIERTTATIHTEVKNAMIALGYSPTVPMTTGGSVQLPNTTLIRDNITPSAAVTDLTNVCRRLNARLEKYIALTFTYEGGQAAVLR